jgi:hypothetical protein
MNKLVVANSVLGLSFLVLAFTVSWLFFAGAVIFMVINQKILTKNKS